MATKMQKFQHVGNVMWRYYDPATKLRTFWKYAKVEMAPPTLNDIPAIQKGFQDLVSGYRTQSWKQLTTKEALINTCVFLEISFWFFVGEIIGRRHFIGYYIPPDYSLVDDINKK